jgi:hypothetical protein
MTTPDDDTRRQPDRPRNYCGPARDLSELLAAFRLVYRTYRRTGRCPANDQWMHLSPFALLPGATTFVARHDGQVVSTITLYPDSPLGLPADQSFARAMRLLRAESPRAIELSLIGDRRSPRRGRLGYLETLVEMALAHAATIHQAEDVAAIMPVELGYLFRRRLGFEQAGRAKPWPTGTGPLHSLLRLAPERRPLAVSLGAETAAGDRYSPKPTEVASLLPIVDCAEDSDGRIRRYLSHLIGRRLAPAL